MCGVGLRDVGRDVVGQHGMDGMWRQHGTTSGVSRARGEGGGATAALCPTCRARSTCGASHVCAIGSCQFALLAQGVLIKVNAIPIQLT